ncbi:MAG: ABC transporter permease [Thermoprotei archaeon]|nr:MAG: ABC transporter permease [Thermoprotei archaeon]
MSSISAIEERGILREILSYKSGVTGLAIILFLIIISIYALATASYDEVIELWRGSNPVWLKLPRNAAPEWIEIFLGKKLPRNINLIPKESTKDVVITNGVKNVTIRYSFNYDYDDFPKEINIFFNATYKRRPKVSIYWKKPTGDIIHLLEHRLKSPIDKLYLSNKLTVEEKLVRYHEEKIGVRFKVPITVEKSLFMDFSPEIRVLKGEYEIILTSNLRPEEDLDAEVIIYGQVYGWAGTDHKRRDIGIAIIWGTPIALAFGLSAATMIAITQLIIAIISGWYGGRVDGLLQRVTEIYMILPFLPFLIMVDTFYNLNIWSLLLVVVILSIFGTNVKVQRALVMQIKNYPYIEAAKAYGASDLRIMFLYILPKILPPIVPQLVLSVPDFVFLEAILAFLGLGDPVLPTWGKIIEEAFREGAVYKGYYYWVLEPAGMLVLTAIAFSLLGLTLDKIVNPRLREQ